jgi:hypothetical protein
MLLASHVSCFNVLNACELSLANPFLNIAGIVLPLLTHNFTGSRIVDILNPYSVCLSFYKCTDKNGNQLAVRFFLNTIDGDLCVDVNVSESYFDIFVEFLFINRSAVTLILLLWLRLVLLWSILVLILFLDNSSILFLLLRRPH